MLHRIRTTIFTLLAALVLPALLAASDIGTVANPLRGRVEDFSNVGNRAAEFLTIPVGARAIGMGNAFVAQADDISSIYWNPAGLGFLEGPQVFFSHLDLPVGFSMDYSAAALPMLDGRLILGGFFGILNISEEEITTIEAPEGTGAFYDGYSMQFGGTMAYNFSDRFSAGFNIKAIRESVFQLTASAIAFDVGTNYHTEVFDKPLRVSFTINNLGSNMSFGGENLAIQIKPQEIYSDRLQNSTGNRLFDRDNRNAFYRTSTFYLPTSFTAGIAMDVYNQNDTRWTLAGQFSENNFMPSSVAFGTELAHTLNNRFIVAARWGWNVERDEVDLDSGDKMRGMGFGGGLEYNLFADQAISIDYAYRDMGRLAENHVFTMMWKVL